MQATLCPTKKNSWLPWVAGAFYNLIIGFIGFVAGSIAGLFSLADNIAALFGGFIGLLIALSIRYLIIGGKRMKRFLIGGLMTAGLVVVPFATYMAISVWGFGNYDPKFGAYVSWMISVWLAIAFSFVFLICFALWSYLLLNIFQSQPIWRYLLSVAIPVVVVQLFFYTGFINWVLSREQVDVQTIIIVVFVSYSLVISGFLLISRICRRGNGI